MSDFDEYKWFELGFTAGYEDAVIKELEKQFNINDETADTTNESSTTQDQDKENS